MPIATTSPGYLGIDDLSVYSTSDEGDTLVYYVNHVGYKGECPKCGAKTLSVHDRNNRRIRDFDAHGKAVELEICVRRFKCGLCGTTFNEVFDSIDAGSRMTNRMRNRIVEMGFDRSFTSVAQDYGFTDTTIRKSFLSWLNEHDGKRQIKCPEVIGVDEAHLANDMRGVITDIDTHTILEILKTRDKRQFKRFFEELYTQDDFRLRIVTMDMYRPYRDIVYEVFGNNVKVVVDRFHVIQCITKSLINIRNKMKAALSPDERKNIRMDRKLMLMNMEDLTKNEEYKKRLYCIFKDHPEFGVAYALKESFRSIYRCTSREEAEKAFEDWEATIPDDEIFNDFRKNAKTVHNWHKEIFNYFDPNCQYTNGVTETINGIVKVINKEGRGYSFDVIRAKMLYGTKATKRVIKTTVRKRVERVQYPASFGSFNGPAKPIVTYAWEDQEVLQSGDGADLDVLAEMFGSGEFFGKGGFDV